MNAKFTPALVVLCLAFLGCTARKASLPKTKPSPTPTSAPARKTPTKDQAVLSNMIALTFYSLANPRVMVQIEPASYHPHSQNDSPWQAVPLYPVTNKMPYQDQAQRAFEEAWSKGVDALVSPMGMSQASDEDTTAVLMLIKTSEHAESAKALKWFDVDITPGAIEEYALDRKFQIISVELTGGYDAYLQSAADAAWHNCPPTAVIPNNSRTIAFLAVMYVRQKNARYIQIYCPNPPYS